EIGNSGPMGRILPASNPHRQSAPFPEAVKDDCVKPGEIFSQPRKKCGVKSRRSDSLAERMNWKRILTEKHGIRIIKADNLVAATQVRELRDHIPDPLTRAASGGVHRFNDAEDVHADVLRIFL
ncbi:MAG: hypothetical protein WCO97_11985, partial [bacterium]